MNWTDERVELLKHLWAEGYSASQIAVKMGGVTRNAVIGKAHRLKLAGRVKTQPRLHSSAAAGESKPAQTENVSAESAAAKGSGKTSYRERVTAAHIVGTSALKVELVAEQQIEPKKGVVVAMARPRHLTLMQLTEHTCKWPLGDPMSDDFSFCGAESGDSGPYCSRHAKLAFNVPADKRKVGS